MNQQLIYLASASPRRRELLGQIGVTHAIHAVSVDETRQPGEDPIDFTRRLALDKATTAWQQLDGASGHLVLGADTTVVVEGDALGKPYDRDTATSMLRRLSGRSHAVHTAVAGVMEAERHVCISTSVVNFRDLDNGEIDAYVATDEPLDKAGAYAIQGLAAVFIESLEGSYSGVMGLPLFETAALLRRFGHEVLARAAGVTP